MMAGRSRARWRSWACDMAGMRAPFVDVVVECYRMIIMSNDGTGETVESPAS